MKTNIILTVFFITIISFFIGLYLYKIDKVKEETKIATENVIKNKYDENQVIETEKQENKILVTTQITEKIYYKDCNHVIKTIREASENYINLTEEDFKKLYPEWEVHKFTADELIIYKEKDGFCDQHYKIKNDNGYIAIYKIDKNGKEKGLVEKTEIEVQYLPEADIKKIEEGLIVYSEKELNKIIEDYE